MISCSVRGETIEAKSTTVIPAVVFETASIAAWMGSAVEVALKFVVAVTRGGRGAEEVVEVEMGLAF